MFMVTQFELLNSLVNNLYKFEITPTTKLVLIYLTRCFNPDNEWIFPKVETMALHLGVADRSIKRAIKELCDLSLLVREKKTSNRYKYTQEFFNLLKLSPKRGQIVPRKNVNLSRFCSWEQKNVEQKNNNSIIKSKELIESYKNIKPSSPLDFTKDEAIVYLSNLPSSLLKTSMNQRLIAKFNLEKKFIA